MEYKNYQNYRAQLDNGSVTCLDTVNAYLNNIEKNAHLNAFLEVFSQDAVDQAKVVDQKIAEGTSGKLAGMVIGLKDNICYNGHKVSAASKILEGFESIYSATVVEKLLKEDAIIIGRLNCDEFAMGSSNENSAFGEVSNPYDTNRVPGGSSGGSAVAVAANLCMASLGSDTGGSIRQPASYCGVVGLKPTYGRVSRHGLIAYASSFDQIGPFTSNVYDAGLLLEVIAGEDEFDGTVSTKAIDNYTKLTNKKYKIAVLTDAVEHEALSPEIKSKFAEVIDDLKANGHEVAGVEFPYLDYLVPTYYVLTTAEASSNLSRFDGVHYGYRSPNATDLESTYRLSRTEGFGAEVKRRIMLGTFVLSAGYYDAYYNKGLKVRGLIAQKTQEIFKDYDFILLPTTADVAFEKGGKSDDPIKMYLEDMYTVQANITGVPAISLPIGKSKEGLPFGLQLMSNHFTETDLLGLSKELMKEIY